MTDTAIEWTDKTWNPVTGCTKVSPGCAHCYAEGVADRFWGRQYPAIPTGEGLHADGERPRQFTDVMTHTDRLDQPLRWKKPARIFVNSMSDLFHEDVAPEFIADVFAVMRDAHWHAFQVLTKRAHRMQKLLSPIGVTGEIGRWPLPNVWLGVSVENQHFADERIPLLLEAPAAVRFISAEPLLGPIDFTLHGSRIAGWDEDWRYNVLSGEEWAGPRDDNPKRSQHLDWVIVGGESGPKARPFDLAWGRSIVQQCKAADVPCFVKQLGRYPRQDGVYPDSFSKPSSLHSKKGGDPNEWPDDLRVREFP